MLYHISENQPPKDEPFLALTCRGFEMMDWKESPIGDENPGWFGFYCPCACCGGHCSDKFEIWMSMPKIPRIRTPLDEAKWAVRQENLLRMKQLEKMDESVTK